MVLGAEPAGAANKPQQKHGPIKINVKLNNK